MGPVHAQKFVKGKQQVYPWLDSHYDGFNKTYQAVNRRIRLILEAKNTGSA